jgi:hypothetical protein
MEEKCGQRVGYLRHWSLMANREIGQRETSFAEMPPFGFKEFNVRTLSTRTRARLSAHPSSLESLFA